MAQADAVAKDLETLVGYNLKRAYVVVQSDFRAALGPEGMSARVFSALSFIVQGPEITQSALARALGIERSGLVAIVDDLEEQGLIRRAAVPGDRRAQALVPTEAGRSVYKSSLAKVRAHEAALLAHLSEAERMTLLGLLRKVRQGEDAT